MLNGAVTTVFTMRLNIVVIKHNRVNQKTHGHIGIKAGLVLIQVDCVRYQERDIIFHAHIDSVFNHIEGNRFGVSCPDTRS